MVRVKITFAQSTKNKKQMKLKNKLYLGAVFSTLLLGTQVNAEEDKVSGWVSFDYNSHFMSYGANVWGANTEDIGDEFLFQPSAGVDIALTDNTGLYFGIWADVNDLGNTAGPGIGSNVQEVDVWLGYYITVGDFTFDLAYQAWMYAGENEGIVDFTVSYDTMFAPYIKFHNRIEAVGGQQKGTMIEIGGTLYEYSPDNSELTLSFPIGVGFSLDDYHVAGEDGYAYSFIGANFSYPLPIPEGYGAWDVHGGLTYYDTDKTTTGNAESGYLTANFGIGLSF